MEIFAVKKIIKYRVQDTITEVPVLFPGYESQNDLIKKLPDDKIISIKTSVPRNLKKHKLIWAVINFAYDNLPEDYEFRTIQMFVDWLKLEVGFIDVYKVSGVPRVAPKSISFSQCDESKFENEFFTPAVRLMAGILGIYGTPEFSPSERLLENSKEYSGIDYKTSNLRGQNTQNRNVSPSGRENRGEKVN